MHCGSCMIGCRHGAKNTLDKNYLWFAERLGTEIRPETLVTGLEEDGQGGWRVLTRSSTRKIFKGKKTIRARGVVLSAGALGTTNLLLKCRDARFVGRVGYRRHHRRLAEFGQGDLLQRNRSDCHLSSARAALAAA